MDERFLQWAMDVLFMILFLVPAIMVTLAYGW